MTPERQHTYIRLLFISHDMGGGIARHIDELGKALAPAAQVVTLLSQPGNYVKLSLGQHDWYFHQRRQFQDLLAVLKKMQLSCVHIHHLTGLLPELWQLAEALQLPHRITLHDYSLINGNNTLSDKDGYFLQDFSAQQAPSNADLPQWCHGLEQWQQKNGQLLAGAVQVYCPSRFVLAVYRAHYPQANYLCCYHPDWEQVAPYPAVKPAAAGHGALRVGVIGTLNRVKGADRLEACATQARNRQLAIEFVLIGKAYRRLSSSVEQLGSYKDEDVPGLLTAHAIDLVWFPALWPETYSYTLSHCLAQGIAVLAPDIGAFPERLRNRPLSYQSGFRSSTDEWLAQFLLIREQLQAITDPVPWQDQLLPDQQAFLYHRDYLAGLSGRADTNPPDLGEFDSFAQLPRSLRPHPVRMRLFKFLLGLTDSRLFSFVQKILPFALQKRIKRWFTHKPLHDLES